LGDTREITGDIVLHIESDFGNDPYRTLAKRAAALSASLPARAIAPLSFYDTDPARRACIEKMLSWFDLKVVDAQVAGIPHIAITNDEGIIQVGKSRQMFVAQPMRRPWADELKSFDDDPRPNSRWRDGNMDSSLVLADRIANIIRAVVGEELGSMLRRSIELSGLPPIRVSKMSAIAGVPERNILYMRRLSAQGFAVRASQGVADRLSMPVQSDAGDAAHWRWLADDVGHIQSVPPLCLCTSGSIEAAAMALTTSTTEAAFAVPTPSIRDRSSCDVVVCGAGSGGVANRIQAAGLEARRVEVGTISLPAARVFVGTDTSQEVADLALGALMAGIIPVIPPSAHSALWAIPSTTCKSAVEEDTDEMAEIAVGLCGAQPRTLQPWHLRGTEVWGRIFGVRSR
jgi:hypothetical protein